MEAAREGDGGGLARGYALGGTLPRRGLQKPAPARALAAAAHVKEKKQFVANLTAVHRILVSSG
jgi:hypothetical protein